MIKRNPKKEAKVCNEIADNCLLVLNAYTKLSPSDSLKQLFKKKLKERYNKNITVELISLTELDNIRGNLIGYLRTHQRVKQLLSKRQLAFFDTIIYVHDAGLATRIFPLSYETGNPSKANIRFPQGRATDMLLPCIAENIPLLKNTVVILPIDHYFNYTEVDIEALIYSLNNYTACMFFTPVPIKRALGALGTAKLDRYNRLSAFYEKTENRHLIPKYSKGLTLANTFQLFTTQDNLDELQKAVDLFRSENKNKKIIEDLNASEWSFNTLVCESLALKERGLSEAQLAMKECLKKYGISIGGAVVSGYWVDWASNLLAYLSLVRKLVRKLARADENNNYFIRSNNIKPSSKLESCVFIDCDTLDLFGEYKNCIFIGCEWARIMNCFTGSDSLFYVIKKRNLLRKETQNKLSSYFLSGRRNIEFECSLSDDYKSLYNAMKRVSDDWLYYHEVLKLGYNSK